jgi:3-(3-hydroxy-phenyl)propionate hydroxylase
VPATLDGSTLNTADVDAFSGPLRPGAPAADAPLSRHGQPLLAAARTGAGFTLLVFGTAPAWVADLDSGLDLGLVALDGQALDDAEGLAQRRYDARPRHRLPVATRRPRRRTLARARCGRRQGGDGPCAGPELTPC